MIKCKKYIAVITILSMWMAMFSICPATIAESTLEQVVDTEKIAT